MKLGHLISPDVRKALYHCVCDAEASRLAPRAKRIRMIRRRRNGRR